VLILVEDWHFAVEEEEGKVVILHDVHKEEEKSVAQSPFLYLADPVMQVRGAIYDHFLSTRGPVVKHFILRKVVRHVWI